MVLIFDLDGVVYLGDTPIPGALEALRELDSAGHSLFFLTNNSTRSRDDYAEKISRMGYPTRAEQVVTSAYATALYLSGQGAAGKRAYVIGESGLRRELSEIGMEVLAADDETPAHYVVAGLDRSLTYDKLRRAHEQIQVHGACFVATNRDATFPQETGEIPGGGAMVAPLEVSTGVPAITIGKPESGMWARVLELTGSAPQNALMVGDRSETDILGAKRLGLRTALVLSGVTRAEEVEQIPAEQRADWVLSGVRDLPALVAGLG
ncbi:MAG: HAD-IIA family hydrolase [Armatimonadota bacterium]